MSGGLFLSLLFEVCIELWLPPGLGSPKPDPETIAHWKACRNYDPWDPDLARNLEGKPCIPGTPAPCLSNVLIFHHLVHVSMQPCVVFPIRRPVCHSENVADETS